MKIFTLEKIISTNGNCEIIDVTDLVRDELERTKLREGNCTVFSIGSTASVTTIEFESGLLQDLPKVLEKIIPSVGRYEHNKAWGDNNAHSHLRSAIFGTSLSIPFRNSGLMLGTWQQIVIIDFDERPRSRRIAIQFIGE